MQPSATTSFSITQHLDAQSAVNSQTTGQVQIYDSLGTSYEATVTYTNKGNNTWDYSVTVPDTLAPNSSIAAGVSTINYNFGASGATLDDG